MANHKGSEGTVRVGANTIAEITAYTVSQTATTIEDTELSDSASTFQVGTTSWSGSVSCFWDETDTAQGAMTIGASVSLGLYPEESATGNTKLSGTALITGIEIGGAINGIVTANFTFQGTGALTIAAI